MLRDESFITSWGGGAVIFRGGGGGIVCDVLGVEKKMTYGQEGSCISSGIAGGCQMCSIGLSFH